MLCDLGQSRIKADVSSRSANLKSSSAVVGRRNGMSLERLKGGLPWKPSDVYAFRMTVYEARPFYFYVASVARSDNLSDPH